MRGECINIDFVTKLPCTAIGNDSIITIIDGLTKWVHWFARREADLSAEKFASLFIEHHVHAHGIPTLIVSDRNVWFQSDFWRAFTKAIGTRLRFSTAFHPQTDGLAEKPNESIQTFLRAYATSNVNAWDKLLVLAEFMYNASVHKVT